MFTVFCKCKNSSIIINKLFTKIQNLFVNIKLSSFPNFQFLSFLLPYFFTCRPDLVFKANIVTSHFVYVHTYVVRTFLANCYKLFPNGKKVNYSYLECNCADNFFFPY